VATVLVARIEYILYYDFGSKSEAPTDTGRIMRTVFPSQPTTGSRRMVQRAAYETRPTAN
jgi:hypothetical protein